MQYIVSPDCVSLILKTFNAQGGTFSLKKKKTRHLLG